MKNFIKDAEYPLYDINSADSIAILQLYILVTISKEVIVKM